MRCPRRLLAAAGVAALLLAGGSVGAPAGATAPPAAPAAPAAPAVAASGVALELEALSPAAVRPGDHVLVRVRVVNGTAAPLDAARVRLFVNSPLLTTRSAVQAWADGDGVQGGDRFLGVDGAEQPLAAPVPPGGSAEVSIDVSADQLRLGAAWGPRGVTVDVLDAGLQRLAAVRTFLVWTPSGTPARTTGLTVLAPLTAGAPEVSEGRLPGQRVEGLTAPGGRLARVLQATSDSAVALALDPALLGPYSGDAVADGGSAGPWLAQLSARAADQEVIGLPEGDPDVEALAAAGQGGLYRLAETQGRSRVQASLGAPARSDVAWPADGVADGQVLDLVQAGGRTAVVLGAASVPGAAQAGSGGTPPARVTLAGREAGRGATAGLLVDPGLSASFVQGSAADPGGRAAALARLLADTAVAASSASADHPASVLVAAPRDWDPDPTAATAELAALRAAPWVRARPLADLLSTPPAASLRLPERSAGDPAALPADGLAQAASAVQRAQAAAGVFEDPAATTTTTASYEERAVAASSSAWRADQPAWRRGLADLTESTHQLADGVEVLQGSAVTVISSEVKLPVTLRSHLSKAATVVVSLRSGSYRVRPQGPSRPVTVAANAQQQLVLPVRALASGDTTLSVVLSTRDGQRIGAPATLKVRVRADWEGRGVLAVAVAVAAVLVLGLVRTARRIRRRPPASGPPGPPGPPRSGRPPAGAVDLPPVGGVVERARG